MVSFIHWHHEMLNGKKYKFLGVTLYLFHFSGSVRLLRTGATQGTPYRYTVKNVTPEDAGFYTCVAGNILGETVSSAFLQINGSTCIEHQSLLKHLLLFIHVLVINHIHSFPFN